MAALPEKHLVFLKKFLDLSAALMPGRLIRVARLPIPHHKPFKSLRSSQGLKIQHYKFATVFFIYEVNTILTGFRGGGPGIDPEGCRHQREA